MRSWRRGNRGLDLEQERVCSVLREEMTLWLSQQRRDNGLGPERHVPEEKGVGEAVFWWEGEGILGG